MNCRIFFTFLIALTTHCILSAVRIANDYTARAHCATHKKSYVAVVWPITPQEHDAQIETLLNTYGHIQYKKRTLLHPTLAYILLQKAHPLITDMPAHIRWYFPEGVLKNPARIYIVHFNHLETAIACKYAIRKLVNLQYRAVHINDTHRETVELAQLLFT